MLFNSYIFILFFLPVTILGYYTLNYFQKYQFSKVFLVVMSLWFYGYFNPSYIFIILASITVNYFLGKELLKAKTPNLSKSLLIIGLLFNIGMLFYFKYFDFFIENTNSLVGTNIALRQIVLPLGISFFTFQQLSYMIDCYKKKVPTYNILDYSLFVTFFPQLVAGPIVLHSEMVPQFADVTNKKVNYPMVVKGLYSLSCGLAKKVLLADTFGLLVNYGFENVSSLNTTEMIFVMVGYTLQIYFDFSGYCDIAMGIGYLFGVQLPINFNSPYKATSILDFWKRWHMTLTRFLTTYLYIPLGGNRKGRIRMLGNIFLVFLISGIWHGANWTFILWGILHGVNNIVTRLCEKWLNKIPKFFGWMSTFIFLNLTWLLFRAESIKQGKEIFLKLFSFDFGTISSSMLYSIEDVAEIKFLNEIAFGLFETNITLFAFFIIFAIGLYGILFMKNTNQKIEHLKLTNFFLLKLVFLMVWCLISFAGVSTFLYFDF